MIRDYLPIKIPLCSWSKISRNICETNELPMGYKIVLLDFDGDPINGNKVFPPMEIPLYPPQFRVWSFLEELLKDALSAKDLDEISGAELRNNKNKVVDENFTLRSLRTMNSLKNSKASVRMEEEHFALSDFFYDMIKNKIDNSEFDRPVSEYYLGSEYAFLRGLLDAVVRNFQASEIEDALATSFFGKEDKTSIRREKFTIKLTRIFLGVAAPRFNDLFSFTHYYESTTLALYKMQQFKRLSTPQHFPLFVPPHF